MKHTSLVRLTTVLLLLVVVLGGAPFASAAPAAYSLDGSWAGATAEGVTLTFTIAANSMNALAVSFTPSGCPNITIMPLSVDLPITGNQFVYKGKAGKGMTVRGTFQSDTQASGSLDVPYDSSTLYPGCKGTIRGTWVATKNGAPVAAVTAPATPSGPTAVVANASLNVRAGPGTAYPVIGSAPRGDALPVIGQSNKCAWLKVKSGKGEGWVAGGRQYVTLNTACSAIPAASAPPPPTPKPTAAAAGGSVAAPPLKGAPMHVDLLNADAKTIGQTFIDNSNFYLPLMREAEGLLAQDRGSCARLAQLLTAIRAAPLYKETAQMLWNWRRERPSLFEQRLWEFESSYRAGVATFQRPEFNPVISSCQSGQWPTADVRGTAQAAVRQFGGSMKLDLVVTYLPGLLAQ